MAAIFGKLCMCPKYSTDSGLLIDICTEDSEPYHPVLGVIRTGDQDISGGTEHKERTNNGSVISNSGELTPVQQENIIGEENTRELII